MTDTDLDELERLARRASPGPWGYAFPEVLTLAPPADHGHRAASLMRAFRPGVEGLPVARTDCTTGEASQEARNGEFMAAANPAVVLQLIGRIRELESYRPRPGPE